MSKKNKLDQYYTDKTYAEYCCNIVKTIFKDDQMFIEPSAGNGSFSEHFENIISFDIEPKFNNCIKKDFLETTVDDIKSNAIFVGNPPFGFASNLALKFINHIVNLEAKAFCFVLPKTFKKKFFKNKLPEYYHCVYEEDTPKNSFILNGNKYDVPCVFQVWEKKDYLRKQYTTNISKYFSLVDKEHADIAIRRVGGHAGKILVGLNHNKNTTYFLKINGNNLVDNLNKLYPIIKEEASNTAGVRSITLQEISLILDEYSLDN